LRSIGHHLHNVAQYNPVAAVAAHVKAIQDVALRERIRSWLYEHSIPIPSHLTAPIAIPHVEELLCPIPPHRQQGMDSCDWEIKTSADTVEIALLYNKGGNGELSFGKCIRIRIPVIKCSSPDRILVHVEQEILKIQPVVFMEF